MPLQREWWYERVQGNLPSERKALLDILKAKLENDKNSMWGAYGNDVDSYIDSYPQIDNQYVREQVNMTNRINDHIVQRIKNNPIPDTRQDFQPVPDTEKELLALERKTPYVPAPPARPSDDVL